MVDINKLLNTTAAGQMAQKLDAADGNKDGKISGSIWNQFAESAGGKNISEGGSISIKNAMNSITTYVVKNMHSQNKSEADIVNEYESKIDSLGGNNQTTGGASAAEGAEGATGADNAARAGNAENTEGTANQGNTISKENAAKQQGLRTTYNENFYYSEKEKEHYKWDNKKQAFVKYPNIAFLRKDGTYRREYKNQDGSRKSIDYSKDGYPTSMQARTSDGKKLYTQKARAAEVLGLKETHATQRQGIYYDTKTKMHYIWDDNKHVFNALSKDTKYVETDGTAWNGTPTKITTVKNKNTGKLISRTEDFGAGNYATTYNANGKLTRVAHKDENGKVTGSCEFSYNKNGKHTKTVSKDKNGKVTGSYEFSYNKNGKHTKSVYKDKNGKVTGSCEYKYDANGNYTGRIEYSYDTRGRLKNTVKRDANGNEI